MRIGIIAAMDEEIHAFQKLININTDEETVIGNVKNAKYENHEIYICKSGIGKVNASIATTFLKMAYDVEYIINIGSAGAVNESLNIYDVVIADKVGYHDVDVSAFNYEVGQVPHCPLFFEPNVEDIKHLKNVLQSLAVNHMSGLILSGDQFINSQKQVDFINDHFTQVMCVEMEAASIAHTCHVLKIPFQIIRAISDVVSIENNEFDFKSYLAKASINSAQACLEFIRYLN